MSAASVTSRNAEAAALGNLDARKAASADSADHQLASSLAPRKRLSAGLTAAEICQIGLTCEDFRAGTRPEGSTRLWRCKKSKIIFQDHNMPLSWENVELKGFEPLTSCMPCLAVPSGYVSLSRVTAGQGDGHVWLSLAASTVVWGRCHLVCHWLPDLTRPETDQIWRVPFSPTSSGG